MKKNPRLKPLAMIALILATIQFGLAADDGGQYYQVSSSYVLEECGGGSCPGGCYRGYDYECIGPNGTECTPGGGAFFVPITGGQCVDWILWCSCPSGI